MNRMQAHFNTIQTKDPKQQTDISRHFNQPGHNGCDDIMVHIVEFIYAFLEVKYSATLWDQHEFKWMHRLRTHLSMGINTMDKPRQAKFCHNILVLNESPCLGI